VEEEENLIWPIKKKRRQRLIHVGERLANEPALITCEGSCSSNEVTWTVHHCIRGPSYECRVCKKVRRWGFDLW